MGCREYKLPSVPSRLHTMDFEAPPGTAVWLVSMSGFVGREVFWTVFTCRTVSAQISEHVFGQ